MTEGFWERDETQVTDGEEIERLEALYSTESQGNTVKEEGAQVQWARGSLGCRSRGSLVYQFSEFGHLGLKIGALTLWLTRY